MRKPTVALINDTSLIHSHFGCQLVGQTFREQFARTGLELRFALPTQFRLADHAQRLEGVDLVIVNGEGSIHHGRCRHLLEIAGRFPSVLVNCVYQANPPDENLDKFLYRSARESLSAAEIQRAGTDCTVVPEVIFASSLLRAYLKPEPTKDLGATDNARHTALGLGIKIPHWRGLSPRHSTVTGFLNRLSQYRRICVGRFHAAIACAVLEIPFATWDSNTWKTRGLMADMGVPQLHFDSYQDARRGTPATFSPAIRQYTQAAPARIEQMFDTLADLARQRCR